MRGMLYGCSDLKTLDLSVFKTDKVTDMEEMFYNCSSLKTIDVKGFKTDNVEDMSGMFSGCSSLTNLDLSGFKTDNVTDMKELFNNCSNLATIYAGDGWSTEKVKWGNAMFYNCPSLVGGQGTTFDSSHTDHTYACIDGGVAAPGYFTAKGANSVISSIAAHTYAASVYDLNGHRLSAPQKGVNIVNGRKVVVK